MLRLRCVAKPSWSGDDGCVVLALTCCNESGAAVCVASRLTLTVVPVDTASLAAVSGERLDVVAAPTTSSRGSGGAGGSGKSTSGAGKSGAGATVAIEAGFARLEVSLRAGAALWKKKGGFRVALDPGPGCTVSTLPMGTREGALAPSHKGVAAAGVELPVAGVITSVIGVVVAAPAVGEFAREACEWIRIPPALSPHAAGGAGGTGGGLLFLEDHMRVSPGFGSIVWDCAVMCSLALAALGPRALAGQRVVDLGCGTGVVGLAAASAGAQVRVPAAR